MELMMNLEKTLTKIAKLIYQILEKTALFNQKAAHFDQKVQPFENAALLTSAAFFKKCSF